jgi:hypothetical protein
VLRIFATFVRCGDLVDRSAREITTYDDGTRDAIAASEQPTPSRLTRMRTTALRFIGLATAILFGAACGETASTTSPTVPVAGAAATRSLLSSPTTVQVVTRDVPLSDSISTSKVIGILGGSLNLSGTGLRIVVPPLALTASTRITVTAVPGNQVAYKFEPHGIHFLVPLVVTQDLSGTSAYHSGLLQPGIVAAYFADDSDLLSDGTALVSELLSTTLSLLNHSATFTVFHFSGYLIATD